MIVRQLQVGGMGNYSYIVAAEKGGPCAVIDPGWDVPVLLEELKKGGFTLAAVLLTHGHYDHSQAVPELLQAAPAPLYYDRNDAGLLGFEAVDASPFEGDFTADLGFASARFIHTPGHTAGSCCIQLGNNLFTGDTLFLDACGRTDLPGSDTKAMYRSLLRLAAMDGGLEVWPGHAYSEQAHLPMADVAANNPCIKAARRGEDDFLFMMGF